MKYLLYESKDAYYLQNTQQILRIQRDDKDLIIKKVKEPSGIKSKAICGILGYIRFCKGYYMILITSILPVAIIGQHSVYHIQDTQILSLSITESDYDENRYLSIFKDIHLNKHFYFSYSYNLSQTIQYNILNAEDSSYYPPISREWNEMFVWNQYLLSFVDGMNDTFYTKVIYGFVDSSKIDIFGNPIFVTLIGRRSKRFAGTRFLKRGITNEGEVANEVETEQIVIQANHVLPNPPPSITSYVVHRGSIPLFWTQENLYAPKPDIKMVKIDPFYRASCKHFEDLFKRYNKPILVWNLVKSKERFPRESYLSDEFESFIKYINTLLKGDFIRYIHFDLSRANKSDQSVISILESMALRSINETDYFVHINGKSVKIQSGIIRVSCIDCLDRTNAAQFFIGKTALGHQLHELNIIFKPYIHFDNAVFKLLSEMYKYLGDIIALQYGGSQLVNTVATYTHKSDWQTHSKDLIESIKRYYNNSFTDVDKQNSINTFLGSFQPMQQNRHIWDMSSDKSLHYKANNNPTLYKSSSFVQPNNRTEDLTLKFNLQQQFQAFYKTNKQTNLEKHFLFNQVSTSNVNTQNSTTSPFEIVDGSSSNIFVKGQLALPLNNESEWKFYKSNWTRKVQIKEEVRHPPYKPKVEYRTPAMVLHDADLSIYTNYCARPKLLGREMLPSTPALSSLDPNSCHKEFGFYKLWTDYSSGNIKAEVKDIEAFQRYVSVGNKVDFISSVNVDEDRGELPGWTRHYKYSQYLKTRKYPRKNKS
eukprot:NODE_289_length_11662_cov_0.555133.p2 type:complete len:763 gc:universal NODE_289_length_11662_cov_0.555133:2580-292(-)